MINIPPLMSLRPSNWDALIGWSSASSSSSSISSPSTSLWTGPFSNTADAKSYSLGVSTSHFVTVEVDVDETGVAGYDVIFVSFLTMKLAVSVRDDSTFLREKLLQIYGKQEIRKECDRFLRGEIVPKVREQQVEWARIYFPLSKIYSTKNTEWNGMNPFCLKVARFKYFRSWF